eukprot:247509-Pelagomonas_calceolata.AAC.2
MDMHACSILGARLAPLNPCKCDWDWCILLTPARQACLKGRHVERNGVQPVARVSFIPCSDDSILPITPGDALKANPTLARGNKGSSYPGQRKQSKQ